MTPRCFASTKQYEEYMAALVSTGIRKGTITYTPCHDCTPDYQMRMLKLGRCAHPETTFVLQRTKYDTDLVGIDEQFLKSLRQRKDNVPSGDFGKDVPQEKTLLHEGGSPDSGLVSPSLVSASCIPMSFV